ncbi:MAG: class I SAM-dependent methyltransferase [Gammaproteobacteria bacterium]|jgi:SAM-dependent methyltransferase|nr:class I SAM-dependent methyltransferase [Gammaproteobacteria bacterium]MDP7094332.1 class I SAM-dependent methyltransferase [Gammaproteobacteria bacterium]MDP7271731.1 class I SAM-dependent methyltransferase [Gammaproteobacteria bacterium]HJP03606.1 class I SAM-dependent methyltransferase [Gammaproteobacteria bacterium]
MNKSSFQPFALLIIFLSAGCSQADEEHYTYTQVNRDGIGKIYMGREISHVMGHRGAGWLERPAREQEERTDLLLESLPLEPDSVVVDLGAGSGYFSIPIATQVPEGRVIAVDIQQEMLDRLAMHAGEAGVDNIDLVLATETDPRVPANSADLVLIVDAYHEFSHPREVMLGVAKGLKPGGLLYHLEYRAEDPQVTILRLHKMTEQQAIREVEAAGLKWLETLDFLPRQHVLVFRKPAA